MELNQTINLMESDNYQDRFKAEYMQLLIRLEKLKAMMYKWEKGTLEFTPTCPKRAFDLQIQAMDNYLTILEIRAKLENIPF